MQNNKIECCNYIQRGRIYNIASNTYLIFIDECSVCGQPIAEIRQGLPLGNYKTLSRKAGKAAENLYKKYGCDKYSAKYKTFSGTKSKEYNFINKFGTIYNYNGVRVAPQDKFLNMSREEINRALNSKYYSKDKIKI